MTPLTKRLAVSALAGIFFDGAWAAVPSRKADQGCSWEKISDAHLGLEAWVQGCQFKGRKIDLFVSGKSLVQRFSDGGKPDPLVDVLDLLPDEKPVSGVQRVFSEHTDKQVAAQCVLAPAPTDAVKPRNGVKRYTFVPTKAYARRLKATQDPNDVPPPPCGEWGDQPDGVQYFEVQPASLSARKILFVRYGQDQPLFDEETLQLLPHP